MCRKIRFNGIKLLALVIASIMFVAASASVIRTDDFNTDGTPPPNWTLKDSSVTWYANNSEAQHKGDDNYNQGVMAWSEINESLDLRTQEIEIKSKLQIEAGNGGKDQVGFSAGEVIAGSTGTSANYNRFNIYVEAEKDYVKHVKCDKDTTCHSKQYSRNLDYNKDIYVRAKVNNNAIKTKIWQGIEQEPTDWTQVSKWNISTDAKLTPYINNRNANPYIEYVTYDTGGKIGAPKISNITLEPSKPVYGSNPDLTATITDSEDSIKNVTAKLYRDKTLIKEMDMDKTGTDKWEKIDYYEHNVAGNYKIEVITYDSSGKKATKSKSYVIEDFSTSFSYDSLGAWRDEALTPNLNATGFKISWSNYKSSRVSTNYTYGIIEVHLESMERNKSVYLLNTPTKAGNEDYDGLNRWYFKNQTVGASNDIESGSVEYWIDFTGLDDYEATKRILGDKIKVKRKIKLYNSSGGLERELILSENHESLKEEGAFFNAIWEAIDNFLDEIGVSDAVESTIQDINDGIENVVNALTGTVTSVLNDIDKAISDASDFLDKMLGDILYGVIQILADILNGITRAMGWIGNWFDLALYKVNNQGLTVEGNVDKNNETFTYYNYSGNYDKEMSDTNMTVMESTLRQYSLNTTFTASEYLDNNNISAGDLNTTEMFTLYNVNATNSSNKKDIKVYSYTRKEELPKGISSSTQAIHVVVSASGGIVQGIMDFIPDTLRNSLSSYFDTAKSVISGIQNFLSLLVGGFNWAFVKGASLTIQLGQLYLLFTGLRYGQWLMEALNNNMTYVEAVHRVLDDMEHKYHRLLDITYKAFRVLESGFSVLMAVLRTVSSYIPFI